MARGIKQESRWRELVTYNDIPEEHKQDLCESEGAHYFKYGGKYYNTHDFFLCDPLEEYWDGSLALQDTRVIFIRRPEGENRLKVGVLY